MTPERWRQIGDLFNAAVRLEPAQREAWLRRACGEDEDLRAEVSRLLSQDERADGDGFLTPPESAGRSPDRTGTWPPRDDLRPSDGPVPVDHTAAVSIDDTGCFCPKAAIAPGTGSSPSSETVSVVRARLLELPIIYILILTMTLFWTHVVLGDDALTIPVVSMNAIVIVALGGIIKLLSSRWPVSLNGLKVVELVMIGMLASLSTFIQYRLMLMYSLRDDTMMAQLTMKNGVLITSILILTYGFYVPKSWCRAALVVGPLALLPFVTLVVLVLRHPEAMGWLGHGWRKSDTPRLLLYSFDALVLLILAAGSAFGARTIFMLRRQVAEARQLGQYHLRRKIGGGGMGEVYLAEHQLLKRPCAIKLIRAGNLADPRALERFEREVRLTATLSHPNTVEIYDYGRTEDGTYYYVMEYLPGLNLAELVKRHGPLPPGRVVYLLRQVCQALREAHAAGLIHRDVKPSNIFAARRGGMDDVAKLLDFGLVRPSASPSAADLSGEGKILGTPLFMSPEQARGGRELDERSDIYSLGAVAYYLLTGRPPFDESDGIEAMIAHARDPVIPPSQFQARIPEDLEHVVLRCLAKDPSSRFPDADHLERALGECACAAEWDLSRAARWWRSASRSRAMSPIAL
ncbi:MAG: serine/threonine-protein kinase [Isosphaeraceae bacterium]